MGNCDCSETQVPIELDWRTPSETSSHHLIQFTMTRPLCAKNLVYHTNELRKNIFGVDASLTVGLLFSSQDKVLGVNFKNPRQK
jgi:hypothetical protein